MSHIYALRLSKVVVTFVEPIVSADISQLSQLIWQADNFQLLNQADIDISDTNDAVVELRLNAGEASTVCCELTIPCRDGGMGLFRLWYKYVSTAPKALPLRPFPSPP